MSSKLLKRTKTMSDTIKEGNEYIALMKKSRTKKLKLSIQPKSKPQSPKKKSKLIKSSHKILKKSIIKPLAPIAPIKKNSKTILPTILNNSIPAISNIPPPIQANSTEIITEPEGPISGMIDIVFCCDTTSSMSSYLRKTKDTIRALITKIKAKATKDKNVSIKFGFVSYRDHPPQESTYVTKIKELCSEKEISDFIDILDCHGGGDEPEAVLDGLLDAAKNMGWRNNLTTPILRYIFHIADAPPHGEIYGKHSSWNNGCPCGLTIDGISHFINAKEIRYRLIKIGNTLENMVKIFKEKIYNYDDIVLDEASKLDIEISDMVIRELVPDVDI